MKKILVLSFALLYCVSSKPLDKNKDPFAHCDQQIVQKIYQTLLDVHDFFITCNIPYWIDSGTLLGSVRHRGLIPWDDDLDLCIFEENEQNFIEQFPLLRQIGYEIVGMPFGYKIYATDGIPVGDYPWTHPGCDIFIMATDGIKAFYKHRGFGRERALKKNLEIDLEDILPLRTYTFGLLNVMGPRNPMPYLYNWYGDTCLEMAYRDYDHGTESPIQKGVKLLSGDDYKAALPLEPLTHHIGTRGMLFWPTDFIAGYKR